MLLHERWFCKLSWCIRRYFYSLSWIIWHLNWCRRRHRNSYLNLRIFCYTFLQDIILYFGIIKIWFFLKYYLYYFYLFLRSLFKPFYCFLNSMSIFFKSFFLTITGVRYVLGIFKSFNKLYVPLFAIPTFSLLRYALLI